MVRVVTWDLGDLGSVPCCAINFLCDIGPDVPHISIPHLLDGGIALSFLICVL